MALPMMAMQPAFPPQGPPLQQAGAPPPISIVQHAGYVQPGPLQPRMMAYPPNMPSMQLPQHSSQGALGSGYQAAGYQAPQGVPMSGRQPGYQAGYQAQPGTLMQNFQIEEDTDPLQVRSMRTFQESEVPAAAVVAEDESRHQCNVYALIGGWLLCAGPFAVAQPLWSLVSLVVWTFPAARHFIFTPAEERKFLSNTFKSTWWNLLSLALCIFICMAVSGLRGALLTSVCGDWGPDCLPPTNTSQLLASYDEAWIVA